jgi:hypothetical protein
MALSISQRETLLVWIVMTTNARIMGGAGGTAAIIDQLGKLSIDPTSIIDRATSGGAQTFTDARTVFQTDGIALSNPGGVGGWPGDGTHPGVLELRAALAL